MVEIYQNRACGVDYTWVALDDRMGVYARKARDDDVRYVDQRLCQLVLPKINLDIENKNGPASVPAPAPLKIYLQPSLT